MLVQKRPAGEPPSDPPALKRSKRDSLWDELKEWVLRMSDEVELFHSLLQSLPQPDHDLRVWSTVIRARVDDVKQDTKDLPVNPFYVPSDEVVDQGGPQSANCCSFSSR